MKRKGDAGVSLGWFPSRAAAEAFRLLLEAEGVFSQIRPRKLVAGLEADFELLVPESELPRARWLLADEFSDAELTYLATGELPDRE